MNEEVTAAIAVIRKACASVVADLENHQIIQSAILTVEAALTTKTEKPNTDTKTSKK
jgi:hypothetical protein